QGDSKDLIQACIAELRGEKKDKHFPSADVVQDIISFSINTTNELDSVVRLRAPQLEEFTIPMLAIARRYADKKKEMNSVDFDDLLLAWKFLLENHPEVRNYYAG